MSDDKWPDPERTVFQPASPPGSHETPAAEPQNGPLAAPSPPPSAPETVPESPPRKTTAHAMVGAVLNHIYRVDRFIAAGGMGAVYEGININTEERVAIKIILPHLAEDLSIQTLFRNEARTLTHLSHPALVQYRLLAQEPQLGVFYIVTEFIDGPSLADVLSEWAVPPEQFGQLAIRLASGLATAHDLKKIHRDISPDNVLLAGGQLERAKIIDFGIAKDLAAINKTVIGDGFAGKFAYVAPEQFGDSRDVGPWTDIYSLGLLLLAVALRRSPPMGATIAGAIEARLKVPDLSAIPQIHRAILAKMLEPSPAQRYQSMREVAAAFGAAAEPAAMPLPPRNAKRARALGAKPALGAIRVPLAVAHVPRPFLIGAIAAIAAALVFVAIMLPWSAWFFPAKSVAPVAANHLETPGAPLPIQREEKVRVAMETAIGRMACKWLDIDYPISTLRGVSVNVTGVGGETGSIAAQLTQVARSVGVEATVTTQGLFTVDPKACAMLDAFREHREPSSKFGRSLTFPGLAPKTSPRFTLRPDPPDCKKKGMRQARVVMGMQIGDFATDFSVLAMDANGGVQQLFANRADFEKKRIAYAGLVGDRGNDAYTLSFCTDEKTAAASPNGLAGILLIRGHAPFDLGLDTDATDTQNVSTSWPALFSSRAGQRGWSTQMAWYQVLDN